MDDETTKARSTSLEPLIEPTSTSMSPMSTPSKRKRDENDDANDGGGYNDFETNDYGYIHSVPESPMSVSEEDSESFSIGNSISDDEEEPEVLWSEDQESYPPFAAYDEGLVGIERDLLKPLADITRLFDAHGCNTETVKRMKIKMREIDAVPDIPPIVVGLLGDAGVGKSSTLNSLLDIPDIANEGSSGRSCTFVVTEYRGPFHNQRLPFAVWLRYADIGNIRTMLDNSLEAFYKYRPESFEDWDVEEIEDLKLQRETALETFLALFPNRDGFRSRGAAETYLEENKKENIGNTFVAWCEGILEQKPLHDGSYAEYFEAETLEELRAFTNPSLLDTASKGEPALWPLLAKASIGLIGPRVVKNMVLADLPGISDTNQARVRATTDYLRTCDALWLVARSDRVITDKNIDFWLQKYTDRFKGNIALICTRSDDLNMLQAMDYLKRLGHDTSKFDDKRRQSNKLSAKIRGLNKRIENLKKKKARGAGDRTHKFIFQREDLQRQKRDLDNRCFEIVVETKNEDVTTTLQKQKQESMPETKVLPVHCISNRHYASLKGVSSNDNYQLGGEGTGIPGLRAYALSLPARAVSRALDEYINHKHSAFFQGLQMWLDRKSVKGRSELLEIVRSPQIKLEGHIEDFNAMIKSLAALRIKTPFEEFQNEFRENACDYILKLRSEWHFNSFKAFCRRDGSYRTGVHVQQSWNDTFLQPVAEKIGISWNQIEERRLSALQSLEEHCIRGIEDTMKNLNSNAEWSNGKLQDLATAHAEGIRAAIAEYERMYAKQDSNIRMDTLCGQDQSYFVKIMQPTYQRVIELEGDNFFDRATNTMIRFLSLPGSSSPFHLLSKDAIQAIEANTRQRNRKLTKTIMNIYIELYNQFAAMVEEEDKNVRSAESKVRVALVEYLATAVPKIESAKARLARLKANSSG